MVIATATLKGQVVIPAPLRRKYRIHQGSRLAVLEGEGQIIFQPLPDDPVKESRGFLKRFGGKSALKALMEDRAAERRRDV